MYLAPMPAAWQPIESERSKSQRAYRRWLEMQAATPVRRSRRRG
ncbi:MAG TPA: hypothetical protein VK103_00775 [Bacillota bacterium]|nr:hypothetical protein [Bacillota bacterium]